jgi:hypothetical protein
MSLIWQPLAPDSLALAGDAERLRAGGGAAATKSGFTQRIIDMFACKRVCKSGETDLACGSRAPHLDDLLAGVTADNLYSSVDTGDAVGLEIF